MHWEREGAFTGEVSPLMLKDAGCTHVLLGHSERRHVFGEDDELVAKKTRAAVDGGLDPVVCVGETLPERESGRTLEVVERQVERALRQLTRRRGGPPRRGLRAGVGHRHRPGGHPGAGAGGPRLHPQARRRVTHGDPVAGAVRILYGGSVKPDNIAGLMAQADVDGVLVGGASLDADSFLKIVHDRG